MRYVGLWEISEFLICTTIRCHVTAVMGFSRLNLFKRKNCCCCQAVPVKNVWSKVYLIYFSFNLCWSTSFEQDYSWNKECIVSAFRFNFDFIRKREKELISPYSSKLLFKIVINFCFLEPSVTWTTGASKIVVRPAYNGKNYSKSSFKQPFNWLKLVLTKHLRILKTSLETCFRHSSGKHRFHWLWRYTRIFIPEKCWSHQDFRLLFNTKNSELARKVKKQELWNIFH